MKGSGIGGQAVMEGVMMKNGSKYAVAVRKPDGDIVVDTQKFKKTGEGIKLFDLPIFRGIIAFIDSLRLGVGTLMYSADLSTEEEEEEGKKKSPEAKKKEDTLVMTLTVIFAVILAIGIFMILPYYLSQLLKQVITSTILLTLCEGLIRIILFIGYIVAISCMKDIKRVFMYHGAEHKSINCVESGLELTVANVRKSSRRHKRCGTSFLLVVMLISIILFMFIRVETAWLRILLRLALIPVIAGISYEFIRLAGKSDSAFVNILSKPGLALQGLTTSEPDDSMIEVAIASVEAVFDWRKFLADYDKKATGKEKYDVSSEDGKTEKPAEDKADDKTDEETGSHGVAKTGNQNQKKAGNKDKGKQNNQKNKDNNKNKNNIKNRDNDDRNNSKNKENNENRDNEKNKDDNRNRENLKNKDNKNRDDLKNKDNKGNRDNAGNKAVIDDTDDALDFTLEKIPASDKEVLNDTVQKTEKEVVRPAKFAGVREALPVEDEEDDEILKALDQYFTRKNNSSEDK